jgi:hypothetical protein
MSETTDLAVVHGLKPETITAMQTAEAILARVGSQEIASLPVMTQTAIMATGMRDLRKALTKELVEAVFMPLQGSRLGFKVDKEYPWEIVRDCIIEASVRGFRPIGNEMNIIGGNFYATQEGLDRKVREYPGLTNLDLVPGIPTVKDGGALVPFDASWLVNGKPDFLSCNLSRSEDGEVRDQRIPVRVNSGQGVDAVLGKAKRKMLARIYERLTGQRLVEDDGGAIDTEGQEVRGGEERPRGAEAAASSLVDKHKSKAAPKAETMREPGEEG